MRWDRDCVVELEGAEFGFGSWFGGVGFEPF